MGDEASATEVTSLEKVLEHQEILVHDNIVADSIARFVEVVALILENALRMILVEQFWISLPDLDFTFIDTINIAFILSVDYSPHGDFFGTYNRTAFAYNHETFRFDTFALYELPFPVASCIQIRDQWQ